MTTEEIIQAIVGGDVDDDLRSIAQACKDRQKAAASTLRYVLKVGDKVAFNSNIRPAYLQGLKAVVRKVNQTTATVDVVEADRYRARRYATGVRCPFTLLDRVEA